METSKMVCLDNNFYKSQEQSQLFKPSDKIMI